jgi:hypothetical protein
MERQFSNFAAAPGMIGYRVKIAHLQNDAESRSEHSLWDRFLGIATMIAISTGGWIAIIELIRLLR